MDGHVSMREEGGNKKIYEITENGLKELDKIRRKKGELISDMYRTSGKGMIMREVFELGIFLYQNSESLGEKEAEEVIRIISECRERVEEFIRTKVGKAVGGEGGGGVKVM